MRVEAKSGGGWRTAMPRLLAALCLTLMLLASTAQVCHTHDDVWAFGGGTATAAPGQDGASFGTKDDFPGTQAAVAQQHGSVPGGEKRGSAVRCPLCVAMHSVLPVSATLVQVALLRLTPVAIPVQGVARTFGWRFEMASRPPPVKTARA